MYRPSPELRSLQLKCLEILDVVHEICMKHSIQYSLCGGSVVGAHLYGGCIPWDDDVDLMMTRENYNRFTEICKTALPDNYRIINYKTSKQYYSLFTKIDDINTTLVQKNEQGEEIVSGVFLDITCYDKVPKGRTKKLVLFLYKIAQWAFSAIHIAKPKSTKDYLRNLWVRIVGFHPSWLYRFCEKCFVFFGDSEKYTYSELFGAYANTISYPSHIFEHYSNILFEGKKYMIVRDYVEYLQRRYNRTDFREPEEKQVPPHHVYVNLNQPFSKHKN